MVIWGDHGYALGEQGIWGKHALYETTLKSPLIISYPGINKPGRTSNAIVETVDVYPTLTELAGLPTPGGLHGESLKSHLDDPATPSLKEAIAHFRRGQGTIRNEDWRLIVHQPEEEIEGFELFDFRTNRNGERVDPDRHPEVVNELLKRLDDETDMQPLLY